MATMREDGVDMAEWVHDRLVDVPDHAPLVLTVGDEQLQMRSGTPTAVWAYRTASVVDPILVARTGQHVDVIVRNNLGEPTTVHWHGLALPWSADGHPSLAIPSGGETHIAFDIADRAATYWFHPHPHLRTAEQIYRGLAALLVVDDAEDQAVREALDVELGTTDLPLLIADRTFDDANQLVYAPDDMQLLMGTEGETFTVGGVADPHLAVSTRMWRLRLLNASNARVLNVGVVDTSTGDRLPLSIIGTDGGLLEHPQPESQAFLGPAERLDIVIDLSRLRVGDRVALVGLPFDPMHQEDDQAEATEMAGMSGEHDMAAMHAMHSTSPQVIAHLDVVDHVTSAGRLPDRLSTLPPIGQPTRTQTFDLSVASGADMAKSWRINDDVYDPDRDVVEVRRGTVERWVISNAERSMPHPMHLHGTSFRVVGRAGSPPQVAALAVDDAGRTASDVGLKDTLLVWPGETVTADVPFAARHEGTQRYMFHCHILEHEDTGMMLGVQVNR
jgi:blue copper oxidase